MPALLTGFALAFARAIGEYGSVVFISGNMPMKTEIVPLLIITKLEQYDYAGATAIAVVMLLRLVRAAAARSTCSSGRRGAAWRSEPWPPPPSSAPPRPRPARSPAPPANRRVVRWTLIGIALVFLALVLLLPLVVVFTQAFAKGFPPTGRPSRSRTR